MATVEEELTSIKEKSATITSRKARAEIEIENATKRRNAARASLKEEFGVTTTAEAKAKLTELQNDVQFSISTIRTKLEEAGA